MVKNSYDKKIKNMKYFLDLGGHHGEGMMHFIDEYKIDKDWIIYSFEPNKLSFDVLKDIKYKDCNIIPINKGIWVKDTVLKFRPETTSESYGKNDDGAGSTFIGLNDWNINNDNNSGAGTFNKTYDIEVIDISSFIRELSDVEFLLIKMDIEGSEYSVLRKMIDDDTISVVNDIYVEFHDWAMNSQNEQTTNELILEITNKGINLKKWI
jgi:FkbM family methyltransferase